MFIITSIFYQQPTVSLSVDTKTQKRKQETNNSINKDSVKKTKLGTQDKPADEKVDHQSEESKLKKRQRRKEKQRVIRNVDTDDSAEATRGSKKRSSEKTNVISETLEEDISKVKSDKSGQNKKLKK